MSFVQVPDSNPGRCLNYRNSGPPNFESLRCLDYEHTPHVCRFPEQRVVTDASWSSSSTYTKEPETWVAPEDMEKPCAHGRVNWSVCPWCLRIPSNLRYETEPEADRCAA